MTIVEESVSHGLKVALVDKGPTRRDLSQSGLYSFQDVDISCGQDS